MTGETFAVIGAAGGIGSSVTRQLAARGHAVVAVGRSDVALRQVTDPLRQQGFDVLDFAMDLSAAADGDDLVSFAVGRSGRLDGVVNSAAVYESSSATDLDLSGWARTMETNLRGPLVVTSSVARLLAGQGHGRVVHITSVTASVSRGGYTLYEASKAGLVAATRSMAVELAPYGVVVNSVAPGWVRTPMTAALLAGCPPERVAELIPVGRVGEADEVAEVACWLAVDSPSFLTGQTVVVDGGQTARTGTLG
jgi:NAD(P)-dependent dehydrogenase (short-subunit alcohol dehydrogenase family)